jgi:hypothetical protein
LDPIHFFKGPSCFLPRSNLSAFLLSRYNDRVLFTRHKHFHFPVGAFVVQPSGVFSQVSFNTKLLVDCIFVKLVVGHSRCHLTARALVPGIERSRSLWV